MARSIEVTELVLRDAHQSLLATRLTLQDMLPACADLDGAGYWSVECWGGATFDSCIRFLNEDPWERLRAFRKRMPKARLQMLLRGQNLLGYQSFPDDVVRRFVAKAAENGVDVFRVFDPLNDVRNLATTVEAAKAAGSHVQGAITYTLSPVHTIERFVDFAQELKSIGCDSICIKDMVGLLKPQAAYELVRGIKQRCGPDTWVHVHAHTTSGITMVAYIKAIEAGADAVDTSISSLSGGSGHNPTEGFVEMLEATGFETRLDLERIRRAARHFAALRGKYREYLGDLSTAGAEIFRHQVPPGMVANIESQLQGQGAADRLDDVFEEIPRVRADCGYPTLVTPASQIVGTQAVLNVLAGKYKQLTGEFIDLMLGYYGATPGEKNAAVLKLVAQHANKPAITCRPADLLKPQWSRLRDAAAVLPGFNGTDEDVLTYAMFPHVAPKFFRARASGKQAAVSGDGSVAAAPVRRVAAPQPSARAPVTYVITLNGKEHRVTVSEAD